MAITIDKYYKNMNTTPEIIKKFYSNAEKFKKLVEKMPKKNIMYRLIFMKKIDDQMEAVINIYI